MAQFCPYNKYNLNVKTDIKANNLFKPNIYGSVVNFVCSWIRDDFTSPKFEICITAQ